MSSEKILQVSNNKYIQMPKKEYPQLWKFYKEHQATMWLAEEIPYNKDEKSWNQLIDNEKKFIKYTLAFFAGADGIVLENLMTNFAKDIQISEAIAFYAIQGYMEQVHSETYSNLLKEYVKDSDERELLFKSIDTIPCIKQKAQWAMKWMDPNKDFAQRLIAFIIVEGVFFSGAFCSIFWLKNRGLMTHALGLSNQWIARDEALHCNFGIELYKCLDKKLDEHIVHEIFKEAIEIEKEFIIESLQCDLIGMNKRLMQEYIEYVVDYWLLKLSYNKIYNSKNPFPFMLMNQLDGKTNFFEQHVTEYTKSHSINSASNRNLTLTDDF